MALGACRKLLHRLEPPQQSSLFCTALLLALVKYFSFKQTNPTNQLTKQMNKTHLQLRRNKANRLQERQKMCIIASVRYYSSLARIRTMFQLTGSVQISGSISFLFLWDYTHSCIQQFEPHFSSQPPLATAVPFFSSTALDLTMLSDSEVRNHTLTSS